MKGNKEVLDSIQKAIHLETEATNSYMLYANILDDWGISKLATIFRRMSGEERDDLNSLIQHSIFLEQTPEIMANVINDVDDVETMIATSLDLEMEVVGQLRNCVLSCHNVRDFHTRSIFEDMLKDEERHVDFLETQQGLIKRIGVPLYMAQMMGE